MKVNQKTIINKIFDGIDNNGWMILNGLGTGHFNGEATQKSVIEPLIKYLEGKGIEVTR
ncbi:hypothetical protein [Paenibacillus sp. FSL H3-0333]|uniref:hypothetical protein n=1 Tax=Paenibacillus sp. FSL H3-0333 TaxID=2921373 RepID=UPI0030FA40E7